MKLSILIPTLPDEKSKVDLNRLMSVLLPQVEQYKDCVKICIHDAGKQMPTGTKRNELIRKCDTDYFSSIDCDDMVPYYYVSTILTALELNPDVVTFNGYMTTYGTSRVDFVIRLGERYEERAGKYYRFPNHLCVFKRDLVKHIKFPAVWHGEDYLWAKQIHDLKLLKTEVHIEKDMYHYDYKPKGAEPITVKRKR